TETIVLPNAESPHIDNDWKPQIDAGGDVPSIAVSPTLMGPNLTSPQATAPAAVAVQGHPLPIISIHEQHPARTHDAPPQTTNAAIHHAFEMNLDVEKNPKADPGKPYNLEKVLPLDLFFESTAVVLTDRHITRIDAWVRELPEEVKKALGMMTAVDFSHAQLS